MFITIIIATASAFEITGVSKLEKCEDRGLDDDLKEKVSCDQKFVITATIENGEDTSDAIKLIPELEDSAGKKWYVNGTLSLNMRKSSVFVRYPTSYKKTVNHQPWEQVSYGNDGEAFTWIGFPTPFG